MAPRRETPKSGKGSKIPTPGAPGKGAEGGHTSGDEADPASNEHDGFAKIMAKLSSMEANFNELRSDMKEGFQSTEYKHKELEDKVETATRESALNKEKILEVTEVTAGLRLRSEIHGSRLTDLESKIEQLEREKRRNLIVVEGAPESEDNPSPEIIELLFRDLKVGFDSLVCYCIYRRGKSTTGTGAAAGPEVDEGNTNPNKRGARRPRPIVVGFKEHDYKVKVFQHLKNLKGLEKWEKVFISDDLTECQQRQQRDLRALSAYARRQGSHSTVRANCIVVEGKKYGYKDLGRLAPGLTLEKAKTLVCLDGEGIGFQSAHSPLSNLYPCNVTYKGRPFLSAEAALQYTRAVTCKRMTEARAIEFERDAYEVKRIASNLGHSLEWDNIVDMVLEEILIIKFSSNPYCKRALLATGERRLFEATGDRTWACGLTLARIHELTLPTPGKNRTGLALEKVRGIVRGNK